MMNTAASQSLDSHARKDQPPHEQLQEQRSQLKKILEEHRQKEAQEELSLSKNIDASATAHCVVEDNNHTYEDFLSENFNQSSFAVPKPVQVLHENESTFLDSSTHQLSEFGLQGKDLASFQVQLEANELATLTNVNLQCDYSGECRVISTDLPGYLGTPNVVSFYTGAPEENALVYPAENQTNLTSQCSPALRTDHLSSITSRKCSSPCNTSTAEPEFVCISNLDSNSIDDAIHPHKASESYEHTFIGSEHISLSEDSINQLHSYKKSSTNYDIPSTSDLAAVGNSTGEPRDLTATSNEEPESSFSSNSHNKDGRGNSNSGTPKTVNVTVIGPDSLAVPMKRCRKEYFKLQRENRNFKKPLVLQCEWSDCTATFSDSKKFLVHIALHISQYGEEESEKNECIWRLCDSKWQDYNEFERHLYFHALHTHLKAKGEQLRIYQSLPACDMDTSGQNSVPQIPQAFECQYEDCRDIFQCAHHFYLHVAVHINNMDVDRAGDKEIFRCKWGECKALYNRRSRLVEHCQSHTQEKLFACINCGNMFSSKGRFVDHLLKQIPPDELPYQCSCCGRKYATERMVRDHLRHHINHYKCPHCEMTCSSQSSLDSHILYRHSNRKPHPCAHCSKSFKQREDLERHLLAHTDNKLFKCCYADCTFRSKCSASLDSHIKQRHLKMRVVYACHLCSVERTRGNALSQHLMKAHSLSWPTGHSKFFYRLDNEGKFRLQTVRYESLELEEGVDRYAAERTNSDDESAMPQVESRLGGSQSDGAQNDVKSPNKRKRSAPKQPKQTLPSACKARVPPKAKRRKTVVPKNQTKTGGAHGHGPRRKTSKNPKSEPPKRRTKAGGGRKKKNTAPRSSPNHGKKKLESPTNLGRKRKATSRASDQSKVLQASKKRKHDLASVRCDMSELLQTPQKQKRSIACVGSNQSEVLGNGRNNLDDIESNLELSVQGSESNKSVTPNKSPMSSPFRASMPLIA